MEPLVSIICISYNHAPFIKEALDSVFNQSYKNIEVIVMDDGSIDGSQEVIIEMLSDREVTFIGHQENVGYTKTFNEGLAKATGEFIIDFALDDVMKLDFVASGMKRFEKLDHSTGVVYSNADYIDEKSNVIGNHNDILFKKRMINHLVEGDIFFWLLKRYFICTPTMIIRKEVFDRLGGYDETLAYEDFDFWVRSSRYWDYAYLNEIHMQKRKLETSMSASRYRHWQNEQLASVLKVCTKAFHLCKTKREFQSLHSRLNYEYRQCLRNDANELAGKYLELIKLSQGRVDLASRWVKFRD